LKLDFIQIHSVQTSFSGVGKLRAETFRSIQPFNQEKEFRPYLGCGIGQEDSGAKN
jgi:hypothetical protein